MKRELEMNHSLNATEEARGKREDAQIIVKEEMAKGRRSNPFESRRRS